MTLLHGPRSGDLVRSRRGDDLPAGPAELGLHPDHGLEHGGEPPGRLPVGDGGPRARRAVIHVDPRFTPHEREGHTCVPHPRRHRHRLPRRDRQPHPRARPRVPRVRRHYTNAASSREDFRDTEDLDGFFSGWDPETRPTTRALAVRGHGDRTRPPASASSGAPAAERTASGGQLERRRAAEQDPTLEHPRCVFQVLKRHFARYTPEMVADICGCTRRGARRGGRGAVPQLRAASGRGRLLRGRLDPAHRGRAVHPRRGDHAAPAGQHRPARRRDHGPARPRLDPGLDRHPDAVQHPARLPADAAAPPTRMRAYLEANTASEPASGANRRLSRLSAEGW